ncbi:MAG: plasmid mobilization protein [Janthinobacterium lividum]
MRTRSIASRFTPEEEQELTRASQSAGMYTAEWARDVLLREARTKPTEAAVFTELVALRMLLNSVLRPIALGQKMTPEAYAQVLAEVRTQKHNGAKDMLAQYQNPTGDK